MNRFKKALGVGFVFTLYVMCFYFFFAVMQALFQGTDVVSAAVGSLGVGAVLWAVFTLAIYEFLGFVEERNKANDELRRKQEDEYRKRQGLPPVETGKSGDDKKQS